ncbi:MAG: hypothetical protein EPO08_01385 [Rhodospirillaceae bacterium]|nr:MAG: hypothetical protein EPO08_01385 [Rhodospirillaceae bacterium]
MSKAPTPVLLVGSVPLRDESDVFSATARILGQRVKALPDGETGERSNWINWQKSVMDRAPMLERRQHVDGYGAVQVDLYAEREGYSGEQAFPPLGYADAAVHSYRAFQNLMKEGRVAPGTRFQVSLPTPFAPMMSFISPNSFDRIYPLYVAAMRREMDVILANIPNDQLSVQWDAALEFAVMEGVFPAPIRDFEPLIDQMANLSSWVPADVTLGFHLCYGDAGHKHFKEPEDTSLMVKVMNQLLVQSTRPINWFHLPVPIARSDEAYYAPLVNLRRPASTTVYLGLVHVRDGIDGALGRARCARRFLDYFGIATECGFGRRPSDTIIPLLELQSEIAQSLDRDRA